MRSLHVAFLYLANVAWRQKCKCPSISTRQRKRRPSEWTICEHSSARISLTPQQGMLLRPAPGRHQPWPGNEAQEGVCKGMRTQFPSLDRNFILYKRIAMLSRVIDLKPQVQSYRQRLAQALKNSPETRERRLPSEASASLPREGLPQVPRFFTRGQ